MSKISYLVNILLFFIKERLYSKNDFLAGISLIIYYTKKKLNDNDVQ